MPAAMTDQLIQFLETTFVEEQFYSLARRKFAFSMLALAPLVTAAFFGARVPPSHFLEPVRTHDAHLTLRKLGTPPSVPAATS
jgi:hypothetical protein